MNIKRQIIFILWDEMDGYHHNKLYLDRESAEIGLNENYTDHWIVTNKAKIEEVGAVSYES